MKLKFRPFLTFSLFTLEFFGLATIVLAQHFVSNSYIIDWGNFNITSGNKSSTTYKLTDTVGQNAPGQYNTTDYIIKSGFQYSYDVVAPFSFQISSLAINFGSLVPGIGVTATNTVTIATPSLNGYQIMALENHPLRNAVGSTIPNVACDSAPGDPCTITTSKPWTLNTTYGFGFNAAGINSSGTVTGIGTSNYFTDTNYYRPFANAVNTPPDNAQILMSNSSPTKSQSARISYKVNISATQTAGNYDNGIIFIAIPKY